MSVLLPAITETDLKKINLSIQQLGAGRSNAVGTVTLALNVATTTVNTIAGLCAPASVPILIPTTANAAVEFGAGTWFISSVGLNTFTITHTNSASPNRTFLYAILG